MPEIQFEDPRVGLYTDAGRVRPQKDIMGQPYGEIHTEMGLPHSHWVVIPNAVAPHLIEAARAEIIKLIEAFYVQPAATPAQTEQTTDVQQGVVQKKRVEKDSNA